MSLNIKKTVEVEITIEDLDDDELLNEMRERGIDPECDERHIDDYSPDELLDRVDRADLIEILMHPPHVQEAIQDMKVGITRGTIALTPRIQELFAKIFMVDL